MFNPILSISSIGYRDATNSMKTLFFSEKLQEFTDKDYERKYNENVYPIKVQSQSEVAYYTGKYRIYVSIKTNAYDYIILQER